MRNTVCCLLRSGLSGGEGGVEHSSRLAIGRGILPSSPSLRDGFVFHVWGRREGGG